MIYLIKYSVIALIVILIMIGAYSFYNSFNLRKKIDYYKNANMVIAETFKSTDKINDNYLVLKHTYSNSIINKGSLSNEEIKYMDSISNSYNNK